MEVLPFNPLTQYPVLNPQSSIVNPQGLKTHYWQHKHNELESRDKTPLIGLLIDHSVGNNRNALVMQTIINSP